MYLLTAVAADELAAEVPDLGYGILTHSLLAGADGSGKGPLAGKGLPGDRAVDVLGWFGYARTNVPGLYKTYTNRLQQVEVAGSDQPSFPLIGPQK